MVSSLPELSSVTNNIASDTQGILILKDSLIVSGISTLANAAKDKQIPLITSDQGSVQSGADFALGVHERQIGVEGGKLAAEILSGKPACDLPVVEMRTLTVFVNPHALQLTGQHIDVITSTAKNMNYVVESTGTQS
jgi:putative tryptophan/tyrosine transport system substrate-binding protein